MKKFIKPIAFAVLGLMLFKTEMAHSQQVTSNLSQKLPFDNEVKTGKLPNGFQYFIRKNTEPKNRVTMYLAVKAGSILENEKQLGLAHFLEHMNFNGLKHFPKNALVDYLQKVGVSFGHDLNAYTSFDETVYQLPIPSDDPEILKNGLQVVRDWAQDALLTSEEIDKERGVVMEEMRGNRGASKRLQDKFLPTLLNFSRYAQRLPIGTEEIITKFPHEEIRKFHRDWYRPDLQALVVVGDIDVAQMENEIKRLFSDLKTYPNAPKRDLYNVPLLNKNQFLIATDPEMPITQIQVIIKHLHEKELTVGDYRKSLLKSVYAQMINSRLGELRQSANPPFLGAFAGVGEFMGGLDAFSATVSAKPNELETGFKALVRELERVQKYGFTQSEFDRAIASMSKNNEVAYTERDKKQSQEYVQRYISYFLREESALSNEDDYQLTKNLLPTLTLKEVNQISAQYYVDTNRDIIIIAPEKDEKNLPSQSVVNQWFSSVEAENITPYEDKVSALPILANQPQKGSIVSQKNLQQVEAKELVLSNGVKVILKPTDFKNDQIHINGFSQGGTSLYTDKDYHTATFAASLVQGSGLGQLNNIELKKQLTGKNVGVAPYIGERSEGISGYSDKEGLKTAFELIYGYFTEPRIDDEVFQSMISRNLASLANREDNPQFVFAREMRKTLYGGNIRRMPINEADIQAVSKERALQIYKDRFADASDFTFVIVGSFSENEIRPLLEEYLASLPSLKRGEKAKDLGLYEPKKGVEKVVSKGKDEGKTMVLLSYYGDYKYSEMENLAMDALESVLTIKLIERLREDEGGVYSTRASVSYSKLPKGRMSLTIAFGTATEKYKTMINSALEEIANIKKNGVSQTDLEKFKIELKRKLEVELRENSYWTDIIMDAYQNQEPLENPSKILKNLDKITSKSVQEVAKKYLDNKQLFKFILLPEGK